MNHRIGSVAPKLGVMAEVFLGHTVFWDYCVGSSMLVQNHIFDTKEVRVNVFFFRSLPTFWFQT